jgi:hypothetical protein
VPSLVDVRLKVAHSNNAGTPDLET